MKERTELMKIQVAYPKQIKVVRVTSKEAHMTGFKGTLIQWKPVNRTFSIEVKTPVRVPSEEEFKDV